VWSGYRESTALAAAELAWKVTVEGWAWLGGCEEQRPRPASEQTLKKIGPFSDGKAGYTTTEITHPTPGLGGGEAHFGGVWSGVVVGDGNGKGAVMSCQLTKTELKGRTLQYWEKIPGYDCYIKELLGRELKHVKSQPDGIERLRGVGKPVHTLALTVGESFEPLLQVVCVLRPKRVVLILNSSYGETPGSDHGEDLKQFMLNLSQAADLPDNMRPELHACDFCLVELANDTPTQVFRALRKAMQKAEAEPPEGSTNVVDITGAKKSMVVGAFLYAAHSGLPITYVDFDEYDKDRGRPYGYTCRIGEIANPYEAFHLRDWEQVRRLYNSYNFRDARALLGKPRDGDIPGVRIMGTMSNTLDEDREGRSLYEQVDVNKVAQLARIVEMYEAWDSGDFSKATEFAAEIPESVTPSAVTTLGANWPIVSAESTQSWPTDIYADASKLRIYAYDELKRIERLIDIYQDFRSAFLRSGGLSEVLVAARIVDLIVDSSVKSNFLSALRERTPGAEKMFKALLSPAGQSISLNDLGLRNAPKASVTVSQPMKDWWCSTTHFGNSTGWETFLDRRNVLTHRYVAVSEDLAKDALRFAVANFEDFIGSPLESLDLKAQAVTWHELCNMLQLDFLPPQLRTNIQEV
jgi:hypothetical protein